MTTRSTGHRQVAVLKSARATSTKDGWELPYRLDQLAECGYTPRWSDVHFDSPHVRRVSQIEARVTPFAQAWTTRDLRADADATLAIFESEGHGLAALYRVPGRRHTPLIIIACWLADLAVGSSPFRRRLYRELYRSVDAVIVFSGNQRRTLVELLGIPASRIHVVRFGVDFDEMTRVPASNGDRVVAVGRDLGRDWRTLAAAADGAAWDVDLVTRPSQLEGLTLPPNIRVHPRLDRGQYLELLAGAGAVAVPTHIRQYPTGQSVLLEAMALGKACVVTDSEAMSEYVVDRDTALLVPPYDPETLRSTLSLLMSDSTRRIALGNNAQRRERAVGGTHQMWSSVAKVLDEVVNGGYER